MSTQLLVPASLLLAAASSVLLPEGARLHLEPDASSISIAVVEESLEVVPEAKRDGWILVRYAGRKGWVKPGPPTPLFEARRATAPASDTAPAPWDSFRNGAVFPSGLGRELTVDRWQLRTDLEDEALLTRIRRAIDRAPPSFEAWWKLSSKAYSGQVLYLFARREDVRALDPLACGRIRNGVVTAAVVPGDPDATVRRALHQAGHLYAVQLLGSAVPPWLEEGIADSFAAIGEKGPGNQEPLFRSRSHPQTPGDEPLPIATILGAGRELFADDARGALLRRDARRLARYFWNGGRPGRFDKFRSFVAAGFSGAVLHGPLLERMTTLPLSRIEADLRTFREPLPSGLRSMTLGGG